MNCYDTYLIALSLGNITPGELRLTIGVLISLAFFAPHRLHILDAAEMIEVIAKHHVFAFGASPQLLRAGGAMSIAEVPSSLLVVD